MPTEFKFDTQLQPALEKQQQKRAQFAAGQKGEGQELVGRFSGAIAGQTPLLETSRQLEQERGLPQLREASSGLNQQITGLRQQLSRLPEQVQGQTRGFDVNAAQLAKIQQAQAAPLQRSLSDIGFSAAQVGQQLAGAESGLDRTLGLVSQQQERELAPFQFERGVMADQQAREATGFNQGLQNELTTLLQKQQQGFQLSVNEQQQLNALALQEQSFEDQKAINEQQLTGQKDILGLQGQAGRQVVNAGGRILMVDNDGNVVADLGASPSTGGGAGVGGTDFSSLFGDLFGDQDGGAPTGTPPTGTPPDTQALDDLFREEAAPETPGATVGTPGSLSEFLLGQNNVFSRNQPNNLLGPATIAQQNSILGPQTLEQGSNIQEVLRRRAQLAANQ